MEVFASEDFTPVHLTAAQILILETMWKDGGNLPNEVAKVLELAPTTVGEQLSRIKHRLGTRHWFASFIRFQEHRGTILTEHVGRDERAVRATAKLDVAEALMREALMAPVVTKWTPSAVPELLVALEALAKARRLITG